MIALICLFFPAVTALWVNEKITKRTHDTFNRLAYWVTHVILINASCFFLKMVCLKTGHVYLYQVWTDMVPNVALKYLAMAVPIALLFAVVEGLLWHRVEITVEQNNRG